MRARRDACNADALRWQSAASACLHRDPGLSDDTPSQRPRDPVTFSSNGTSRHSSWPTAGAVWMVGFACLLLVGLIAPTSSWAYRPFIATDAAVADPKEVEIELGYFTLERENGEAVAEFAVERTSNAGLNLIDPALSLKWVLKEGVLQEKEGVSLAIEAGLLLPSTEPGQRHFGFEGVGIASAKLGPTTFHVNGGLGIQRSAGDVVGIWGVIGELPIASGLRLVGEVDGDKAQRQELGESGLLGLIWQPWSSQNVAFDAGIRRRFAGGGPDWQFTVGVTFGFSTGSLLHRLIGIREAHGASNEYGAR